MANIGDTYLNSAGNEFKLVMKKQGHYFLKSQEGFVLTCTLQELKAHFTKVKNNVEINQD